MNNMRIFLIAVSLVFACMTYVVARDAQTGFDQLKSLSGEWEGTGKDLKGQPMPVKLKYEIVSGGHAVMETMEIQGESMISIYHQNGDTVMMTHYCMTNTQPRMQATSFSNGSELAFSFLDVSNLSDQNAHYITGVIFNFQDQDHISQQWSHRMMGKDNPMVMEFVRVK